MFTLGPEPIECSVRPREYVLDQRNNTELYMYRALGDYKFGCIKYILLDYLRLDYYVIGLLCIILVLLWCAGSFVHGLCVRV